MALDYNFNHTGVAHHDFDGAFITHCIFASFLLLFTIPFRVQAANIYQRLHFCWWICTFFQSFHSIFQTVLGLYQLAKECCNLQKTLPQIGQQFVHTLAPPDKFLYVLTTTSSITHQPDGLLWTTESRPETTLVYHQDWAPNELESQQIWRILAPPEISFYFHAYKW